MEHNIGALSWEDFPLVEDWEVALGATFEDELAVAS